MSLQLPLWIKLTDDRAVTSHWKWSPFRVKSSDILPSSPARQKRAGEIVETGAGDLIQNETVCPWEMVQGNKEQGSIVYQVAHQTLTIISQAFVNLINSLIKVHR